MFRVLMLMVPLAMVAPATALGSTPEASVSGTQSPAVVVIFGRGDQVFDVGPLPELGKKKPKKAAKKKSPKNMVSGAKKKNIKDAHRGSWLEGYRAGIQCKVFLLFWSYVHRWSCKPVVARNQVVLRPTSKRQERMLEALKNVIGEKYKLSDHKLGWWVLNGRWVVGGVLLLLILMGIGKLARRRRY